MIVALYVVSIVAFCVAAWIVPLCFAPIVWLYKSIAKEPVVPPAHPVFLMPFVSGAVVLLYFTRYIWAQWGYNTGWLFPTIIAVIHVIFGIARGANRANQAQAFGTVCGVLVYGLSWLIV
jgi:hypothetical protein